jgi:hypothetical protein
MKRLDETPPEPEVRAGAPVKKLVFALIALAVLMASAAPAGAVQGRAPEGAVCAEPVISREYTTATMTHRLAVDLHGCDWWDGS